VVRYLTGKKVSAVLNQIAVFRRFTRRNTDRQRIWIYQ